MNRTTFKPLLKRVLMPLGLLTISLVVALNGMANNVIISDVKVINNGNQDVRLSFDLSWMNSWHVNTGQNNYDGVYVFFKYRVQGSNDWLPVRLSGSNPTNAAYSIFQSPVTYQIPNPYLGAIVYRNTIGTGSNSFNDIQLGVYQGAIPYNVDIKAFAIEMVYIPRINSVYTGDGDGTQESTYAFHVADKDNNFSYGHYIPGFPLIGIRTDANAFDDDYLNWENGKQLFITDSGFAYANSPGARNNKWPTGQALWCMKYEISQGAYRDFLNSLTPRQQASRIEASTTAARGTLAMATSNPVRTVIKIDTPATAIKPAVFGCDASGNGFYNEAADGDNTACGYLSWPDIAAYLAWAGLSPLTEIEYERICWGNTDAGMNMPVFGGYAWGNNLINTTLFNIGNLNASTEYVGNLTVTEAGNANYAVSSPKTPFATGMPLRDGIFAAYSGGATRSISGAAFFGVMELSGNLSEPCVTLGNNAGRFFQGSFGDGGVDADGFAFYNAYGWPGATATNDTTSVCSGCAIKYSTGTILRGGNYSSSNTQLRVANRSEGQASVTRKPTQGGRGVLYVNK